jgi:AcrR family transcriptional regulator
MAIGGGAKKPGIRERKKEETRRVILKCANALFHERGYATATLEDIAQRAGVHKQSVLRYFGSKEAIALAFRQIALQKFKSRTARSGEKNLCLGVLA